MIFKNAAQGDERAYMTVKNTAAASITTGYPAILAQAAASFDGTQVTPVVGAGGRGFVGIAWYDIPGNSYGSIQCLGPVASVFLSNVGTSLTINIADPLSPAPAGFFSGNPLFGLGGYKYILASNVPVAVSAAGYASGYIRAI